MVFALIKNLHHLIKTVYNSEMSVAVVI